MNLERVEHPWLGTLRPYGDGGLIGQIEIDPAVRPARLNGGTDAEVLITTGSAAGAQLDRILTSAAERIRAALSDLEQIKVFALAHAPQDCRRYFESAAPIPLKDRLFLERFAVLSSDEMEISFDFGDLELLVVRVDGRGRGHEVFLAP